MSKEVCLSQIPVEGLPQFIRNSLDQKFRPSPKQKEFKHFNIKLLLKICDVKGANDANIV